MPEFLQWSGLIGGILAAIVTAYLAFRKGSAEITKQERNGVLEEWRAIAAQLRQENETTRAVSDARISAAEKEIVALRLQVTELYTENSKLRGLIAAKETHVEQQAVRVEKQAAAVEKLQTAVAVLKEAVPVPAATTTPEKPPEGKPPEGAQPAT